MIMKKYLHMSKPWILANNPKDEMHLKHLTQRH